MTVGLLVHAAVIGGKMSAEGEKPKASLQRAGLYPNKRQWWIVWIAVILIVMGLMAGGDGMMFAFCVSY